MATPPVIRMSEWDISYSNPSGVRHQELTASGFLKNLGRTSQSLLDFGSINNTNNKVHSNTKAIIVNVDDMQDATEAIYNLRFWCPGSSDFTAGTYYLNAWVSGAWIKNCSLTDTSGYYIGTSLPSGQNLWRQDGGTSITASGADAQSSMWVYLSISADTDVPPKTYGGTGSGLYYRLTYDYR